MIPSLLERNKKNFMKTHAHMVHQFVLIWWNYEDYRDCSGNNPGLQHFVRIEIVIVMPILCGLRLGKTWVIGMSVL